MSPTFFQVIAGMAMCFVLSAATADGNPWIAIAEKEGKDFICNAKNVPGGIVNPKPTNQDERFTLYLRCEAKGGKDEFVKESCCEHLSTNDAKNIGVCPDIPVDLIVPIRKAFVSAVKC